MTEFHTLLLNLLQKFQTALNVLTMYDESTANKDTSAKDPTHESAFNKNVCKVHLYGFGLLRISRGRTFQLHLENIESFLVDPLAFSGEGR